MNFSDIIKNCKFIDWDIIPEASCIVLFFGNNINPDTLKNIEAVVTISTFGKINYAYKENGN